MSQVQELQSFLLEANKELQASEVAKRYLTSRKVEGWQVEKYCIGLMSSDRGFRERIPEGLRGWLAAIPPEALLFPLYSPFFGYTGILYRSYKERLFGHMSLPSFEVYPRFFGSEENLQSIYLLRSAFLVEGPFDFLAMNLAFSNVVSTVTASVSKAQLAYLLPVAEVLVCAFDVDREGDIGWKKLEGGVRGKRNQAYRLKFPYKDPSESLAQKGKQDFVSMVRSLGESLVILA